MTSQARNIAKSVTTVIGAAYASQTRVKIEIKNVTIENNGLGEENISKVLDTLISSCRSDSLEKFSGTSLFSRLLIPSLRLRAWMFKKITRK